MCFNKLLTTQSIIGKCIVVETPVVEVKVLRPSTLPKLPSSQGLEVTGTNLPLALWSPLAEVCHCGPCLQFHAASGKRMVAAGRTA